jgi:hypothetical protein
MVMKLVAKEAGGGEKSVPIKANALEKEEDASTRYLQCVRVRVRFVLGLRVRLWLGLVMPWQRMKMSAALDALATDEDVSSTGCLLVW